MDEQRFDMDTNLVVKDKATAMQYAIEKSVSESYKIGTVYDEDCLEFAKKIFNLFCENVNLPDVVEGGGTGYQMSQETANELDIALQNFKKSCDSLSQMSVVEETLRECSNKLNNELNVSEQSDVGNTTAKTYEDVAKELFEDKECFYIGAFGNVCDGKPTLENTPDSNNCTSRKQAEKLLAINKLMNVAKYLNGDWRPTFAPNNQNWFIYLTYLTYGIDWCDKCSHIVYFKSRELAQQAIDILGEDTIRLALSTEW